MVGDVVGGYEVKEALGSGKSGLLYLAVQASGHRAVVRRRLGDDDVHEFARESAQSLGLKDLPPVERRKSRAGVPVLLAIVDPHAPGSGYTDHTNTVPLPSPEGVRSRTSLKLPVVIVCFALVGALSAAVVLSARSRPLENSSAEAAVLVVPVQHVIAERTPASVATVPPKMTETLPVDAGVAVQAIAARPRVRSADVVRSEPTTPCIFDDDFRDYARQAVAELRTLVAPSPGFAKLENEVGAALVERDCRRVTRALANMQRAAGVEGDE